MSFQRTGFQVIWTLVSLVVALPLDHNSHGLEISTDWLSRHLHARQRRRGTASGSQFTWAGDSNGLASMSSARSSVAVPFISIGPTKHRNPLERCVNVEGLLIWRGRDFRRRGLVTSPTILSTITGSSVDPFVRLSTGRLLSYLVRPLRYL